jgi:hypothetical protein
MERFCNEAMSPFVDHRGRGGKITHVRPLIEHGQQNRFVFLLFCRGRRDGRFRSLVQDALGMRGEMVLVMKDEMQAGAKEKGYDGKQKDAILARFHSTYPLPRRRVTAFPG